MSNFHYADLISDQLSKEQITVADQFVTVDIFQNCSKHVVCVFKSLLKREDNKVELTVSLPVESAFDFYDQGSNVVSINVSLQNELLFSREQVEIVAYAVENVDVKNQLCVATFLFV